MLFCGFLMREERTRTSELRWEDDNTDVSEKVVLEGGGDEE